MEQDRRVLPELLKLVDQGDLQLVECREDGIREFLAEVPKDLLSGIELWTVG